ncbi:hypothetical protein GGX14DRAFT_403826 [Mycena pura]|uniref:Uncharacterized protein n=1 Tax=Mycena pura TaxID=153505 RepID=A0AAD6UZ17_9AGAR|nr:hypothetical protein GGX14DRAFT_403826 [Mycena pura]
MTVGPVNGPANSPTFKNAPTIFTTLLTKLGPTVIAAKALLFLRIPAIMNSFSLQTAKRALTFALVLRTQREKGNVGGEMKKPNQKYSCRSKAAVDSKDCGMNVWVSETRKCFPNGFSQALTAHFEFEFCVFGLICTFLRHSERSSPHISSSRRDLFFRTSPCFRRLAASIADKKRVIGCYRVVYRIEGLAVSVTQTFR